MINIFVAKLDYSISSEQLKQEFQNFGRVNKATIAMDRETGKSRGFAFIEMANREEGENAIKALNGKSFNGRPIAVKEADDRGGNKRNKGAAPFKKPFEKKPSYTSDSSQNKDLSNNRYSENENQMLIDPVENLDLLTQRDTRKKSKEKSSKPNNDDLENRTKKVKNLSSKKYNKYNDFDDDDDDISLLSLRKELEREEFEDDDDDDDEDFDLDF